MSNLKQKGTTKSLGNKDKFDRFYTNKDVALYLINLIPDLNSYDLIIEPSAGSGAFSNHLFKKFPNKVLAYDIAPAHKSITKADWFEIDINQFSNYKKILVVGNPPFGTNGNLALDFFKKAALFADTIAFILPKSFMKNSMMNKIPSNFHLEDINNNKRGLELDDNSFSLNDKEYSVPSVFQIWKKNSEKERKLHKSVSESKYFTFVDKNEADFRVQRVGGNAGKASYNLDVSAQSNYFVKLNSKLKLDKNKVFNLINELKYETISYTVGPKSLSKTEFITYLDKELDNIKQKTHLN